MNGDWDDYLAGDHIRKYKRDPPRGKLNSLLTELLEKEEEIIVYKNRLKELETAFYYNLELISERDLELSVLEKQLGSENEQLQDLIRERNDLEDLVKAINDKNNKKIKQLETKLSLKGEEIKDIQRENIDKVNTMKRLLDDVKHQHEKKISKLSSKYEKQKEELIKGYQEEMEEKERYYLLEIDNLAGKLAQICLEKEELLKADEENKNYFQNLKRHFIEKENQYLEEIKKKSPSCSRKINREIQCNFTPQVSEKKIQAQPHNTTTDSQTDHHDTDSEHDYLEKIYFLQEQNEVLKYIVKDLKRNRDVESKPEEHDQPPGCECLQIRIEIDQVNKKFETEINNLKKILEEEQKLRTEEDLVIQSLETSTTFLKDKLVLGLQQKLKDFEGDDICAYTYNRELQNEIQVTLLEQKLSTKMDSFLVAAEEENKKVHKKIEQLEKEWLEKMEKYVTPRETEFKSENLLEKIRMEIQKLENKIESDMKNLVRNNSEKNKCDKNFQTRVEFPEIKRAVSPGAYSAVFPEVPPTAKCLDFSVGSELGDLIDWRGLCLRNELSPGKHISFNKCSRRLNFPNKSAKSLEQHKGFRKVFNNLVLGR